MAVCLDSAGSADSYIEAVDAYDDCFKRSEQGHVKRLKICASRDCWQGDHQDAIFASVVHRL